MAMLLIPSIDLRGGRCVRLREGDFAAETAYAIEPGELIERYRALGLPWVHIVDLDGAKDGRGANSGVITSLARGKCACLQVGGGVRGRSAIETLLSAGVARVVIGTAAVERPAEVAEWLREFGPEHLCLAFDVRLGPGAEPQVRSRGWTRDASLTLAQALEAFRLTDLKHVLCTDIGRDGTLRGPNLALYRKCLALAPDLRWQASGGIRDHHDLNALSCIGVAAAVSGTALLEERIATEELRPFLPDASSPASTSAPV